MTLLENLRQHKTNSLISSLAKAEKVGVLHLADGIRQGAIVVPLNKNRNIKKACAIGRGLRTKVNANLGTSTDKTALKTELNKLKVAIDSGADTVMDLSVGGNLEQIRKKILQNSDVPVGTVPIYEVAVEAFKKNKDILAFDLADILEVLRRQAEDGVDFFTIHAGVTKKSLAALKKKKRLLGVVSRGGAILSAWIFRNRRENPFYEYFDEILKIARQFDVTLSLGDGLRPGSIIDATDPAQISELKILGELAKVARSRGVQVMIEGPGHVPINQIKENVILQKKFCHQAPFYVLGPLVTDVAAGHDQVSSAIGSAIAASYGADFLCYVTNSEHLRHPGIKDVKEAVICSRIAAHAADLVKGIPGAIEWDRKMSLARKARDWKKQINLSIDPEKAREYRSSSLPHFLDVCTMCGEYCSIKLMEQCRKQ